MIYLRLLLIKALCCRAAPVLASQVQPSITQQTATADTRGRLLQQLYPVADVEAPTQLTAPAEDQQHQPVHVADETLQAIQNDGIPDLLEVASKGLNHTAAALLHARQAVENDGIPNVTNITWEGSTAAVAAEPTAAVARTAAVPPPAPTPSQPEHISLFHSIHPAAHEQQQQRMIVPAPAIAAPSSPLMYNISSNSSNGDNRKNATDVVNPPRPSKRPNNTVSSKAKNSKGHSGSRQSSKRGTNLPTVKLPIPAPQLQQAFGMHSQPNQQQQQRPEQQQLKLQTQRSVAGKPSNSSSSSSGKLGPLKVTREGIPANGQVIGLAHQLQQARSLGYKPSNQELEYAGPLRGPDGRQLSLVPDRDDPGDFPEGYVAICAVIKDQADDMREWSEYHKYIGIKKIYIYDNNSSEPLANHITDFLQSGLVEYVYWAGQPRYWRSFRTSPQWHAYNDCLTRFRYKHRWIAFIDADEFIVLHNHSDAGDAARSQDSSGSNEFSVNTSGQSMATKLGTARQPQQAPDQEASPDINTFMRQYDRFGGLGVNWRIFGSGGHKERPVGGSLVNYRRCLKPDNSQNTHVKVIANTKYVLTVGDDPHQVLYYNDKYYTVNELGGKVSGSKTATASHAKIALYHYLTKSEAEYRQKMRRGSGAGNFKNFGFFEAINKLAATDCNYGVRLGLKCCPSVTEALGPERMSRVRQSIVAWQQ